VRFSKDLGAKLSGTFSVVGNSERERERERERVRLEGERGEG